MKISRICAGTIAAMAVAAHPGFSCRFAPIFASAVEEGRRAPALLSETGLYLPAGPGAGLVVDPRNRRFSPQYPLWTDGAAKSRWIYLPAGTVIDARDDAAWEFPVGTKFWKEFAFDGRRVETRMLWKVSASAAWVVASYRWNEAQTDAALVGDDGEPDVAEVAANRRHSIPSTGDCRACHGTARLEPLGFNPLQLSTDRDPGALHAEALSSSDVTLKTLVDAGLLSPARRDLVDAPPRIGTGSARTRAMLGYLSSNCGSCHRGDGEIAVSVPSLRYADVMRDGDAVAAALIRRPTAWSIPGSSGTSVLVEPGVPERSALHARMRSRSPSSQMPPLGTVLRDEAAVAALAHWILSDLAAAR